jgi:type IV secretory pathway VirB3-like protein
MGEQESHKSRSNQVVKALCRPPMIAGMRSEYFWLSVLLVLVAFSATHQMLVIAATVGGCWFLGTWISTKDRQIVRIMLAAFSLKAVYDARKPGVVEVRLD